MFTGGIINAVISIGVIGAAAYIGYRIGRKEGDICDIVNRAKAACESAKKAAAETWEASGKPRVQKQTTSKNDFDEVCSIV